ncbi:MAG: hypothetical protein K0Q66_1083 [Chitinophagaceae bacterium]|nr:hypothetical protein [Chitinophagaceae bacterium]
MEITSRLKENLPANTLLTRYVDLHSFLYFITQSKLRFARLDTFEDLNEGFCAHTAEAVKDVRRQTQAIGNMRDNDEMLRSIAQLKQRHSTLREQYRRLQKDRFACCWYIGEKESVAMWNLYSNADSVAIRFNANSLIDLVTRAARAEDLHFTGLEYGQVEYADLPQSDHRSSEVDIGFVKDVSFSHEQEFRFMARRKVEDNALEFELCLGDLKRFDFTIISHPLMVEWKIRNLLNVLSCYQLSYKFQPSELGLKNNFEAAAVR